MSVRSMASLTIAFGMVSIPVKLYAATSDKDDIKFNMLHKGCGSRLKQQLVCATEGVVVERSDVDKGYEFAKDQYVTVTPEELKALEEQGSNTLEICEFVPAESVDPVYYDKAYFLGPEKGSARAYALLAESMRQTGRTAIGRYAARGKQIIVQLRVIPGGIVMQKLLYAPEVRSIADVGIETAVVKDAEVALGKQLIESISTDAFNPAQYKDDVRARVEELLAAKVNGDAIVAAPAAPAAVSNVVDLMDVLRASLATARPEASKAKAKVKAAA